MKYLHLSVTLLALICRYWEHRRAIQLARAY